MPKLNVCLETSSYLPLIWITPYSQGVINLIQFYRPTSEFYIQEDCLVEALSYIRYTKDWTRHPSVRLRKLAKILTDKQLANMSFPSSAFQILLGGKMWAQGLYLNFVRHTTFLYADLVDKVDFLDKRKGLEILADKIDERFELLKGKIESHLKSSNFEIDMKEMFAYWGRYYVFNELPDNFTIRVWRDKEKFERGKARIRDVYHYESMLNSGIEFEKMVVANTGFSLHIKRELKSLPIEIISAQSRQTEIFE